MTNRLTAEDLAAAREWCGAATRRPIPECPGYQADDSGHIWSTASNWRGYGVRRLEEDPAPDGYLRVRLYRNGRRVRKPVHVLVALAFHGAPVTGREVRHLDGTPTNNVPSNLLWGTRKENAKDRDKHGRTARGSRNGQAKLTEGGVLAIRQGLASGLSQRRVAALHRVMNSWLEAGSLSLVGRVWH